MSKRLAFTMDRVVFDDPEWTLADYLLEPEQLQAVWDELATPARATPDQATTR